VDEILKINPDKIYLYATNIDKVNDNYKIEINSKQCIATLNKNISDSISDTLLKYNMDANIVNKIVTVKEVREGKKDGYLFSAGSIIQNEEGNVLMIERDLGAPSDPLHWQLPSGRCEEVNSYNVAKAELDEEIFASKNKNKYLLSGNLAMNHDSYRQVDVYVDKTKIHSNNSLVIMDKENNTLEQLYLGALNNHQDYTLKKIIPHSRYYKHQTYTTFWRAISALYNLKYQQQITLGFHAII